MKKKDSANVIREFYRGLLKDEERETFKKLLRMDRKRREEVIETLIADHVFDFDEITKKVLLEAPPMTRKEITNFLAAEVRTSLLGGLSKIVEKITAILRRYL